MVLAVFKHVLLELNSTVCSTADTHFFPQEAAVAADQERCAALARLEKQDAQLADLGQQLSIAICACRSAAANDMADVQAETMELQVMQQTSDVLCHTVTSSMLRAFT